MDNCIIYLIGYPGVGKYTIAQEICRRAGFRLVDNHLVNNTILSLVRNDGSTPLSSRVWENIDKIWEAVLDTLIHTSSPKDSFVLTNFLNKGDEEWFLEVEEMAAARSAVFLPVILRCSVEENIRRVAMPGRHARHKMTEPDALLRAFAEKPLIEISHSNLLQLEVTDLSPEEAAKAIITHLSKIHNISL